MKFIYAIALIVTLSLPALAGRTPNAWSLEAIQAVLQEVDGLATQEIPGNDLLLFKVVEVKELEANVFGVILQSSVKGKRIVKFKVEEVPCDFSVCPIKATQIPH